MTRFSAALALLSSLSLRAATAEPCSPRVELTGDRDAIARVAVELTALGVVLGAAQPAERSCSITAMVTEDSEGIAVAVQNAAKRSEGRVVSDPKIAAAWIDSWLRDEIEVSTWAVVAPPPVSPSTLAAMPSAPASAPSTTADASATVQETSPLERFGLSVAVERSWTDDKTTWDGFDLAGCLRLGLACIGARVRAGFQDEVSYLSSTASRSDVVALATVSVPFSAGQVSLAPELGVGVGRLRTKRVEACTTTTVPPNGSPGCNDPMDPTCTMEEPGGGPITPPPSQCYDAAGNPTPEIHVGDNFDEVTYLPRVAIALRASFPIVRHVWLDGVAAFTLTPITKRIDPDTMVADPSTAMPPEPTHGYQLGVGIRVGIP